MKKHKLSQEEKSKISRNNRSRGFAFERKVAKKFQSVWKPNDESVKFMRTAGSGGSQWKDTHGMQGDVLCTDPDFPLHLECKCSVAWKDFQQCLTAPKWVFWDYMEQAESDCPPDKIPVVIMTKPGSGTKTFICGRMWGPLWEQLNSSHYDFPIILLNATGQIHCWAMEFECFLHSCMKMVENADEYIKECMRTLEKVNED